MRVVALPICLLGILAGVGLISRGDGANELSVPPEVKLVEVGRFEEPVHVTSPPGDDRLFIVERTGRIWVLVPGRRLRRPFLDIADRVSARGLEEGLLSLAFAPDYSRRARHRRPRAGTHRGDQHRAASRTQFWMAVSRRERALQSRGVVLRSWVLPRSRPTGPSG